MKLTVQDVHDEIAAMGTDSRYIEFIDPETGDYDAAEIVAALSEDDEDA